MRKKYLVLLLIPLLIVFAGCGKKKHVAPPPEPNAPSNLTATAVSYKQINLSWQDNSAIEDGFKVCCDMGGTQYEIVGTLPANSTSFNHSGLQALTTYTYYVMAYQGSKHASSREVSATTPCPVHIVLSVFYRISPYKVHISGEVKNNADESVEIEVTGTFYGYDGAKFGTDTWEHLLDPYEQKIFTLWYEDYRPVSDNYDAEITKAKILY